jgi:hypothetical protein
MVNLLRQKLVKVFGFFYSYNRAIKLAREVDDIKTSFRRAG